MADRSLEKVIHKKVKPIVDEALHKFLGLTIEELNKDISDTIESRPLVKFDIKTELSFKAAKKLFKKEFLKNMIETHYGNISEVARTTGLDRRSIHRAVKELRIDVKKVRHDLLRPEYFRKEVVDGILKETFDSYKQVIHPKKMEEMYENVSTISQDIVKDLPVKDMTWKEAEREFEKQYIKRILEVCGGNLTKAAKKMKIRYETLLRKMKKLSMGKI